MRVVLSRGAVYYAVQSGSKINNVRSVDEILMSNHSNGSFYYFFLSIYQNIYIYVYIYIYIYIYIY